MAVMDRVLRKGGSSSFNRGTKESSGGVNGVGSYFGGGGNVSVGQVGGSYTPGSVRSEYTPGNVRSDYTAGKVRSEYDANTLDYDSSYKPQGTTAETTYDPKKFDFDYKSSPGYQFQRDENLRSVTNRMAARGMGGSGEEWAALMDRSQNLAAQDYGNQWQRGFQENQFRDNQMRYADDIGYNRQFQEDQYSDNQQRFLDTNKFNQTATKFNANEQSRQYASSFGQQGDQMNEGNRQFAANFGQRGDQMNEGNRQFSASFGQQGDQMNEGNRQFGASFGQRADIANANNSLQSQNMNFNQNMQTAQFNQGLRDTKWNRLMQMSNMGYGATNAMVGGSYGAANQMSGAATGIPQYNTPQGSVLNAGLQSGAGFLAGAMG